jgi:hypothetical protein
MPTYVKRSDGTSEPATEAVVILPDGLDVRQVVVRWNEVVILDADGQESILIQRGVYPGAGFSADFGDHVQIA